MLISTILTTPNDLPSALVITGTLPKRKNDYGLLPLGSVLSSSSNVNCFDVDKRPDAEMRQFASETAFFDTAKGQSWVGLDKRVDETVPGIQLIGGYLLSPL